MPDLSKNELDNLFQQGVEEFDFPYNEAAWQQMETLLDKDDRRRLLWIILLAGLLTATLLWGGISYFSPGFSDASKPIIEKPILSEQSTSKPVDQDFKLLVDSTQIELDTNPKESTNLSGNQTSDVTDPISKLEPNDSAINQSEPIDETNKPNQALSPSSETDKLISDSDPDNPEIDLSDSTNTKNTGIDSGNPILKPLENDSISDFIIPPPDESIFNIDLPIDSIQDRIQSVSLIPNFDFLLLGEIPRLGQSTDPFPTSKPRSRNQFLIGLLVGLERTSAGSDNFSQTSYKVGLDAEYRFGRHFGVSTGALISRKIYDADQSDYKAPTGFWTRGIAANSTEAACTIFEVPIQFAYYFKDYRQSGFYAKGGLSTYFMLRELYNYNYDNPEPDLVKSWVGKNTSQHYFGVAQFSAGYQSHLGGRSNIQFEPYFQLPLTGVGFGSVRLFSIGANVRMQFQVNRPGGRQK